MATISRDQLGNMLYQAGVRGDDLWKLIAIAGRESSYRTDAHRSDRDKSALSGDRGLFQINYIWDDQLKQAGIINQKSDLFDPATNIKAALYVLGKQGYSAWGAGSGGWTQGGDPLYGTSVKAAQEAAYRVLASPPGSSGGSGGAAATAAATTSPYVAPVEPAPIKTSPALTNMLKEYGISYPNAPAPSAAMLAFMRGLGLNLATAEDTMRTGVQQVEARTADSIADLERSAARGKENITGDLIRRGVLQSGESNQRYARQAEDVADRRGDIYRSGVEATTALEQAYEQAKGGYRTQALEKTLGLEQELTTAAATTAAQETSYKRQLAASNAAQAAALQAQEDYARRMEQAYGRY